MVRRPALPLALILLAVAACTYRPGPNKREPANPSEPAPRRGGVLNIAVADDAGILDPQLSSEPSGFALVRATQRGLMAFPYVDGSDGSSPVPDLAQQNPEISSDGLTYTFRLRSGISFGSPANRAVESGDVKAGIERLFTVRSPLRSYFHIIAGAAEFDRGTARSISGIATPDATTVVITLRAPANDLLWMLAHTAASAIPAGLAAPISSAQIPPSGPYRVSGASAGREIVLVRNPAWKPESDPVRKAFVTEIRVRVGTSADVDITGEELPPPEASNARRVESGCLLYLFASPSDARVSSAQVRAGISLALDRPAIIAAAASANASFAATPTASLLHPVIIGANQRTPVYDPRRAATMVGKPFSISLGRESSGPDAAADQAAAMMIGRQLKAVGITAQAVGATPPGSIYDRYAAGELPLGLARWCPDWPGRGARTVVSSLLGGQVNYARVSGSPVASQVGAALAARTDPDIARLWTVAEAAALRTAIIIPVGFAGDLVPVSLRTQGFVSHPFFVRGDPTSLWLSSDEAPAGRVH